MFSFEKKYNFASANTSKYPIARILKNDKDYGFIYYESDVSSSEEEVLTDEYESDEDVLPNQCPYCKKIMSCKKAVEFHIQRNSCKAKVIADYLKFSKEGKEYDQAIVVQPDKVQLHKPYKFAPLANKFNRENLLVIGPQNSGKSYYTAMYANSYKKVFPQNEIIIASRIIEDDSFKTIKDPIRMEITEDLIDDPIDIKGELTPSLTIFDDIDDSRYSKELSKYAWDLNTEVLVNGRDQSGEGNHIYTVTTMHITEGLKTRKILNEATSITLFTPLGYQDQRILKLYCSLSVQQINKVKKLKTRWISIYCKYQPLFIMTEREIFLLNDF